MTYAALVSLEQTTDVILNHHKYSISDDEREQITSIREYIIFLISFFDDLPEKANRLEGKIRDLANEAEDLIEYFIWNQSRVNWRVGLSRVEVEQQLKRVRGEIGSITGDMMEDRPAAVSSSRAAATVKNDVVIGLDADLLAIKDRIYGESSKLEVIPIVGMGGIGKTTLARNAYNVDEIISCLGHLVAVELSEKSKLSMAEKVYRTLKGRRYLIVMDDIWSTNAWDDVRYIFPDDENGSRIMLTTRNLDIASYTCSDSPVHEMKFMDENQSWDLVKQKVFTEGQDCTPELERIGKEIAGGCRGLPLALVLVAGILSTMVRTRASLERIAKNINSIVDGQLEKILSLSYRLLPHHLRPCFLFMAGFPEDHTIRVSRLIKLWLAEGFLRCRNGCKSLEEEAEEYVEDLVKRSLVLVTSRKSDGNIKNCRLHDLVRELCIRKAQEEKFLATGRYVDLERRKEERRISIGHSRLDEIWGPSVHTILCFGARILGSSLASLVSFRLLRVLDVIHGNHCTLLPPQVFELFHLRFLSVGFANKIPAAISNLENLQTLIIRLRVRLVASYLPMEIWRMPRLKHLVFTDFYYMLPDPAHVPAVTPLQNLQTLSGISSFVCSKRILKMIPNLKKLGVIYNSNKERYDLHNLVYLHQLQKLKITASSWAFSWQGRYPAFPSTLKKLTLVGGRLPWEKMSIVGSLANLEVLKLKKEACNGDTWETRDGEFVQLKYLLIEHSNLKWWITERDHFPRLKRLKLHYCRYLTEIPHSIGEISTLEMIEVDTQIEALVNSVKLIQEDQRNYGNDALQVRCKLRSQQSSNFTGYRQGDRH